MLSRNRYLHIFLYMEIAVRIWTAVSISGHCISSWEKKTLQFQRLDFQNLERHMHCLRTWVRRLRNVLGWVMPNLCEWILYL